MIKTYKLSEVAKKLNVSVYKLRFYYTKGLFPNIRKNDKGFKIFTKKDFEWLFVIDSLQKSGMTINDIKNYVNLMQEGDTTIGARDLLLEKQKKEIEHKIKDLIVAQKIIQYKSWLYSEYKKHGTTNIKIKNTDLVPEDLKKIESKLFELKDTTYTDRENR